MQRFDCLALDCPIFGSRLIEASAGTGKTFAIEHIFVRLLLQSDIEVEQILVVTFTRFATSDLRRRIRENIKAALQRIRSQNGEWEYLRPYFHSAQAIRKLSDSLSAFDRCQIFTIHGFCYRMLQEFAFEANLGFSLNDPDRESKIPKKLRMEARKFLESGINPQLVCPEQLAVLFKDFDSLNDLAEELLKKEKEKIVPFFLLHEQFAAIQTSWKEIELEKLLEDFHRLAIGCKAMKGRFQDQITALIRGDFQKLLTGRGSLFAFLDPSNKKVKAKTPEFLHYPGFFEKASLSVAPLIHQAIEPKNILGSLRSAWKSIEETILLQEQWFDPDTILLKMKTAVNKNSFASRIREKYGAAIIDEFQDTDPLQWEIFQTLFVDRLEVLGWGNGKKNRAFYLVGDPKQSIYRFRQADVYTYIRAREALGKTAHFCLDTNYRSSPGLIGSLNALFARDWLPLPKIGQTISCLPVKAGALAKADFSDGKGSLHVLMGNGKTVFEDCFLPYAIAEIEKFSSSFPFGSFAILVKDRYQADIALRMFQNRSIPVAVRSHVCLGQTPAFKAIREVFESFAFPSDPSKKRIVEAGPFSGGNIREGSLSSICYQILQCPGSAELQRDKKQVVEALLSWEANEGYSLHGVLRFLEEFENLSPQEGGRCCQETEEDAVQILTLHASKGLEFEIVFALGLTAQAPDAEEEAEELEAEKLRQLYVAMTRAKRRLYVPLLSESSRGTSSPMELFCKILESQEGPILPFLERLSKKESLTYESLSSAVVLPPSSIQPKQEEHKEQAFTIPSPSYCFLQSFTSLAQPREFLGKRKEDRLSEEEQILAASLYVHTDCVQYTSHTIPKGVETGILIHQIFEKIFSSSQPIWRDEQSVDCIVETYLKTSSLLPWKQSIRKMIWGTLNQVLCSSFSLTDLQLGELQAEMEFLFSRPPNFIKGSIDLVFMHGGKIYFADWKTNWLGEDDKAYVSLEEAMTAHDYWLQAALYSEALRRHVKRFYTTPFEEIFGGAFYLFIRGGGVCHFMPSALENL